MSPDVALRPATWIDCWRIWRWRNNPSTRRMMRHRAPIPLADHVRWYQRVLRPVLPSEDRKTVLFVAMCGSHAVGFGRVDMQRHSSECELGILVAPACRGRGYGRAIVGALAQAAFVLDLVEMVAVVRVENEASRRAFERNGFLLREDRPPDDKGFVLMSRSVLTWPEGA